MKEVKNVVETVLNLFTVRDGKISILLVRKTTEPYKGYWVLPTSFVSENEALDENISHLCSYYVDHDLNVTQNMVFGDIDRHPTGRVLGISYVGFVDSMTVELNSLQEEEIGWFDITTLPKLGYDHDHIIGEAVNYLRTQVTNSTTLKTLYPSDFTLPEIQKIYEIILNKPLDRRNFRKKFLHFGLIEETGDTVKGSTGRPAKLYRFSDDIEKEHLF